MRKRRLVVTALVGVASFAGTLVYRRHTERNRTRVDASLLTGAPRLKVVGRLGVGLDNIDLPACEARRIDVIPATGANARSVAEYVIGAALHDPPVNDAIGRAAAFLRGTAKSCTPLASALPLFVTVAV